VAVAAPAPAVTESVSEPKSYQQTWFWEGNVQAAVASWLERAGWVIERVADTHTREAGIDVVATRASSRLCIEVKGYPSTTYARGTKAGEPKPTAQATQARHWFAGAVMSAMILLAEHPRAAVAIALPDFKTYRTLLVRIRPSLEVLGIGVLLVSEGGVDEWLLPNESRIGA
jgi:hypothetical protein